MQLEHRFSVPAPRDVVWKALLDPERVAPCMPGATITKVEGNQFSGTVKVKLGPVNLTYKGSGEFVETDEQSSRVVIKASGKDNRGNGTASATVTLTLTETLTESGASTEGAANTDLRITGKPAQFGRGMISDVGGKILESFVACLSEKLGAAPADASPQSDGATASTTATSGNGSSGAEPAPSPTATATATSAPKPASTPKPVTSGPRGETTQTTDEAEPIDLLSYAGSSVAKRAIPAAVAVLVAIIAIILWRRR